jgi:hypothetical protein
VNLPSKDTALDEYHYSAVIAASLHVQNIYSFRPKKMSQIYLNLDVSRRDLVYRYIQI